MSEGAACGPAAAARVDFHTGVADKLGYTCRLLRKAWRAGSRVVVVGSPEQLSRLDALLWTFEAGEFIPHARLRAGQVVAPHLARTPIWLADLPAEVPADVPAEIPAEVPAEVSSGVPANLGQPAVLVNLGPGWVAGWERFPRVIEIVAEPADDVASGRQRWRQYLAAGITPDNYKQSGS